VIGEPPVNHAGSKLRPQVDREMGQAEAVCELARPAHGLRRAAAELAVVLRVRPQLEGHADRVRAVPRDEQCRHRAVDASAHRDESSPLAQCEPGALSRARAECPVQRVRRKLRGVRLGRHEPAELIRDIRCSNPRGLQEGAPADERDHRAAGGHSRPAAVGVKACVGYQAVLVMLVDLQRDADQIATRGSTRGTGERVRWRVPPAEWMFKVAG
jgi:hypothetical protein